jgi:putative heme-binding domain-containing protein
MEQLIALVEESIAPPQLLTQAVIAEKLAARADVRLRERAKELTSGLPPKDAETPSLIARVHHDYLENGGGAERGATVFEKHCAACHQLQGKGLVIGPQLDGVGGRGLARLLEDLLDTNRNVDVAFRTTILELKDGRLLSGLRRRQEGGLLVLADAKGEEFRGAMDEIEESHASRLSLMPTNFGQVLSNQQLRDLLAYLLAVDTESARAD